jgi:molybdate transport system substrate-binding protein
MTARACAFVVALVASTTAVGQQSSVRLHAAGSLRVAMNEVVRAFKDSGGPTVVATFGASGLLRERIEQGEPAEVFASADLGNPPAQHILARHGFTPVADQ